MSEKYKIAIATTDGERVNAHFGSAPQIIIYQAENEQWTIEQIISFDNGNEGCTGQHEAAEERLYAVEECQYIIAARIGSKMQKYFEYQTTQVSFLHFQLVHLATRLQHISET